MDFSKIPDWAQNIALHAFSGFVIGFGISIANAPLAPASWLELSNSLYAGAVAGFYGAVKEVVAYVQTNFLTSKQTAAADVVPAPKKTLRDRML
jgi:hypothetical protein